MWIPQIKTFKIVRSNFVKLNNITNRYVISITFNNYILESMKWLFKWRISKNSQKTYNNQYWEQILKENKFEKRYKK